MQRILISFCSGLFAGLFAGGPVNQPTGSGFFILVFMKKAPDFSGAFGISFV
ncbi:MAG: hypothetical protein U0929_09680 [Planctomycetaceae bacterium]